MKRLFVVVSVICFSTSVGYCAEYWAKIYGGTQYDKFHSVQQTSDNGYIVAGQTNSFGAYYSAWLLKLDSSGIVQWQKRYGGTSEYFSNAYSVQQTSDHGYIVAGRVNSPGPYNPDIWLLKLDMSGTVEWQKRYGDIDDVSATSVQQTGDNGYIVVDGQRLLKLDSSGVVEWQKSYSGNPHSAQQTSDHGYIISFYSMALLKLDSSGVVEWQKSYRYGDSSLYSVQQTRDNGYILAGTIRFPSDDEFFGIPISDGSDGWLVKLDSSGVVQWKKTYGGNRFESFDSVQQTSDNGYIAAGYTSSFGAGRNDSWLLKLDTSGTVQWQKTYGGTDRDYAQSVQQTSDGGYIVAGETDSFGAGENDGWLLKLDRRGNIPGCNIIGISDALVTETTVIGESFDIILIDSSVTVTDTSALQRSTLCTVDTVCFADTGPCPASAIYGTDSEQTQLLRSIRDNVLSQTHEGRELIKLYYQWSPVIVRAMEADEDFKEDIKDLVDEVLGMIEVE